MPDDQGAPIAHGINDQDKTQELPPLWQTSVAAGMYEKRIDDARRAIQTGVHWRSAFARETEASLAVRLTIIEAHHRALWELLRDKGLISRVEYLRAVSAEMDASVQALQQEVSGWQGRQVDLHDPR